ncbi:hypothetical protein HN682_07225 [Candidatus Peregrinibacteria bacterium]|jgi:hypothetical protein|nr:hypothetical protein [Candidatus Peregrinibacteria bacterium]
MDNVSAQTINELFIQKLNSPEGLEKVAQEGSAFIRQKLREVSFARKIIQPQYVTKVDLQRSVNHDGLVKIVDIEPDSKAMTVNFRGNPTTNYVMGERYEIPFYMVSSEDFQKTEEELLAYDMPLTEVIERNSVLDIQRTEDESFLKTVDSAMEASKAFNATFANDGTIKKLDMKTLFDKLDGDELRAEVLLMDSTMYNRLFLYAATTAGDAIGSETHVNGYTYATFLGRRLVVSNKVKDQAGADFLNDKIYAFTAQDFLGQFCVLNDTKFWIEKKKNIISWAAYESIGIGIGNSRAMARMTFTGTDS